MKRSRLNRSVQKGSFEDQSLKFTEKLLEKDISEKQKLLKKIKKVKRK